MIFEEIPWNPQEAWRRICHKHYELIRFGDNLQRPGANFIMARIWMPPLQGKVNLCVDGSFLIQNRCSGAGGLIPDDKGH